MSAMDDPDQSHPNSMPHAGEPAAAGSDAPRFGLLLVVLVAAVALIVAVTFASAAWYGL